MDANQLIDHGNDLREHRKPLEALACYARAFVLDPDHPAAWNNYGNVMREVGRPDRAIPFLEHALRLKPDFVTASFNLAVSHLLMGNYEQGWKEYESRWNYEHLAGTLPSLDKPRWTGQDLQGKRLLIVGEQGLGDTIQFARFAVDAYQLGARIILQVPPGLVPLFGRPNSFIERCISLNDTCDDFDYWCPAMSLPGVLKKNLNNLNSPLQYIVPDAGLVDQWNQRLGKKTRLRVGVAWSGRRDSWINQHKSVPLAHILDMVSKAPQHQWINLQIDATDEESAQLREAGVEQYPNTINSMDDTAALLANLDVIVGVDTAVSHLGGALGRPTWIMLNQYATDWRWLLSRNDSPWYPTVRLFRQPIPDQWQPVTDTIVKHLDLFKI